jgi:protein required for attachment to host cells
VDTWILVSNRSQAKLLSADSAGGDWSVVIGFEHPAGRERSQEVRSDSAPGRMLKSKGEGTRSALEPRTWPKDVEAEHFARLLAEYLDAAVSKHEVEGIVLVAPPQFLGLLQDTVGRQTAKRVRTTIPKDLAMLDPAEIRQRLFDEIFPPPAKDR